MKVRDFIEQEIDIDVYDDVCEVLGIAYCGPYCLTDAGEQEFKNVLDLDVSMSGGGYPTAIVNCKDSVLLAEEAAELFDSLAGFCKAEDFDKWFIGAEMIDEYMSKTDALVEKRGEKWVIDTPQENYYYDSFGKMMQDIKISLDEMAKLGV